MKRTYKSVFPPKVEFERVVKRIGKSDQRTNIGLYSNATPIEKAKYKLCKSILSYKQENNLIAREVAKQLGWTVARTEAILYSHIDDFTLEELVNCANSLKIPCHLTISLPYDYKKTPAKAY